MKETLIVSLVVNVLMALALMCQRAVCNELMEQVKEQRDFVLKQAVKLSECKTLNKNKL